MSVYSVPWNPSVNMLEQANRLYDEAGTIDCVQKGDSVAIKVHVGELGNPYHVQPFFVNDIVRRVKEAGGKPFITDSNTLYHAMRYNGLDHINTALTNGFNAAPFLPADGLNSENYLTVSTKGVLDKIEVSGMIVEADAMIVVTHDKGHELSGFGGAIKNLGMGCCPRAGKLRQHRSIGIVIDQSKCTGCGKCKAACALHLPDIIEGKAHNTSELCMRCPICKAGCPMKAISFVGQDNLCRALASAAYGVLSTFKPKKVSYVSFAKDITLNCDCLPMPGEPVMEDVAIFASDSPVSVDGAFLESVDYKIFNQHSTVDCMIQVQEAKALGLKGEVKPKIAKIV